MIRGRGRGRGRKEGGREEEGREKAEEREREAAQTVTDRVTRAPHSRSGLCSLSPPAPLFPVSRDPWDIKRRRRRLRDSPRDCSHCFRCCWDALTHCRHPIISTRLASRPSLRLSLSFSLSSPLLPLPLFYSPPLFSLSATAHAFCTTGRLISRCPLDASRRVATDRRSKRRGRKKCAQNDDRKKEAEEAHTH